MCRDVLLTSGGIVGSENCHHAFPVFRFCCCLQYTPCHQVFFSRGVKVQIANSSVDDCKMCKDPHCRNYNVKVWSTYYILSTVYINKLLRHRPRLGSSQLEQQSAAAAYICVLPLHCGHRLARARPVAGAGAGDVWGAPAAALRYHWHFCYCKWTSAKHYCGKLKSVIRATIM